MTLDQIKDLTQIIGTWVTIVALLVMVAYYIKIARER